MEVEIVEREGHGLARFSIQNEYGDYFHIDEGEFSPSKDLWTTTMTENTALLYVKRNGWKLKAR